MLGCMPCGFTNGISIGSAVFAGLANVINVRQTDRQTDHATSRHCIAIAHIYTRSTCDAA